MKKLLEEDTGEVPERFHQAMLAAFGQMEDVSSVEISCNLNL